MDLSKVLQINEFVYSTCVDRPLRLNVHGLLKTLSDNVALCISSHDSCAIHQCGVLKWLSQPVFFITTPCKLCNVQTKFPRNCTSRYRREPYVIEYL